MFAAGCSALQKEQEVKILDFTAIDFETATSAFSSICSMGICVVENNKIVEKKDFLIKPEPYVFNDYNVYIHKITPDKVADRGTFDCYWDEIEPYLEGKTIVAHNAQFDVGALRATLDMFKIPYPNFNYICTVKLSQKAYPELESHKLNFLSEALGIKFNHHVALDDAYACAGVLIRILEDFNLNSLEEIEDKFDIGIGRLYPGFHEPCRKNKKKKKYPPRKKQTAKESGGAALALQGQS